MNITAIPEDRLRSEFLVLLGESEHRKKRYLSSEVEEYLAWLLVRYLKQEWSQTAVATAYLQVAQYVNTAAEAREFLTIGDTALLRVSLQRPKILRYGLRPEYFVSIGHDAYFGASVREYSTALRHRDGLLAEELSKSVTVLHDMFTRRFTDHVHEAVAILEQTVERSEYLKGYPSEGLVLQ